MEPRHAAAGARQVVFVPLGVGPHALAPRPASGCTGWPLGLLPATDPARTDRRAEGQASAVDRRCECRDHGPRSTRTRAPSVRKPDCLRVGCTMMATQQAAREDQNRFAVRIRIAVPPEGLGSQLGQMTAWLDANCGADSWSMAPSGTRGVVNDSLAIYFLDPALARAFIARWCIGCRIGV
jgi:hypothetical protein